MSCANRSTIKVIGAGIYGLTLARLLAESGREVEVFEKRDGVGGNCSSHFDGGIEVHDYGPHIFHTSNERVWDFMRRFTEFNQFQLNVMAKSKTGMYNLPFNLSLINRFFGKEMSPGEAKKFMAGRTHDIRLHIKSPSNLKEQAMRVVGRELYYEFIHGYTKKQWGRDPSELPAEIITRIPIRYSYDANYYDDVHYGIPRWGYQNMFEQMADHPNIRILLNREFTVDDWKPGDAVFFTGQIDRLFGNIFGPLPYRGLRFDIREFGVSDYQGSAIVNYCEESVSYTRTVEYPHFHPERENDDRTIVGFEYPKEWNVDEEPFYPIDTHENRVRYEKYRGYGFKQFPGMIYCGRLGSYRYMDMDDAVLDAMETFDSFVEDEQGS